MSHAGTVLLLDNRYRLDQQIASGKYSDIWRGTDVVLARLVAVRLLHAGFAADAPEVARFRTAARHAGLLAHENIARVYDYDESGWPQPPFMVMEFVDGSSLAAVLVGGALEPARVMDLIAQTAAGLHAVHRAGLVHADIRPATLLLDRGDMLKVTHFGLSHAPQPEPATALDPVHHDPRLPGRAARDPSSWEPESWDTADLGPAGLGTADPVMAGPEMAGPEMAPRGGLASRAAGSGDPAYLAPELVAGGRGTPASDLYSLGLVAYQCLAGSLPVSANVAEAATADRDWSLPPLPETAPAAVALLVSDLTAADPARRPRDAAEVARRAGELRDKMITGSAGAATGHPGLRLAARAGRPPRREQPRGPAGGPAAPRGPGRDAVPRSARRPLGSRIVLCGAVVAAAVLALVMTGVIDPGSPGPAVPSNASRVGVGAGRTTLVEVNAAALRGQPASVVERHLRRLGLVVRVRWRASAQLSAGLVLFVRPSGRVPVGSVVVVIGELPSAGGGLSPANPGRPGRAAPARRNPAPGRSQPGNSPTPAVSATASASPAPSASPTAPASPSPSFTPTGTATPSAPASPPATSAPARTSAPSSVQ